MKEPSKEEYVALIRKYVNQQIDEATFGSEFQQLHGRYMSMVDEKINSWPERFDIKLLEAHRQEKISTEEFNKRWHELWGEKPERWRDIVHSDLPYLFDRRSENEEVLKEFQDDPSEYRRSYFVTEEQLKEELKRYLKELESSDD